MRDHINKNEIRTQIIRLSHTLYKSENANILLFLPHLSKDPFIVEQMLDAAQNHYPDLKPASFADDVDFINRLQEVADSIIFEDKNIRETRRAYLEEIDRNEERGGLIEASCDEADSARAAIDPLVRLNSALKTMQIMGQILKNFPGSLDGASKFERRRSRQARNLTLAAMGS